MLFSDVLRLYLIALLRTCLPPHTVRADLGYQGYQDAHLRLSCAAGMQLPIGRTGLLHTLRQSRKALVRRQ